MADTSALLSARDVGVAFGGVRAVDGVSLEVGRREVMGIVGPNGSGKTTFLNALTGVVAATGAMSVEGVDLPLGKPRHVRAAGLLRLFQAPQIYTNLDCVENVMLSTSDRRNLGLGSAWCLRPLMWKRERARRANALECLDRVGLGHSARRSSGLLSYGQRRLLELARAIAASPRLLMLDEPSAGLDEYETEQLGRLCCSLRDENGLSLIVVDHKIDFIDVVSDRVAVFELGRLVTIDVPQLIWQDERVRAAYLGTVATDA